jgi:hypothetical protein
MAAEMVEQALADILGTADKRVTVVHQGRLVLAAEEAAEALGIPHSWRLGEELAVGSVYWGKALTALADFLAGYVLQPLGAVVVAAAEMAEIQQRVLPGAAVYLVAGRGFALVLVTAQAGARQFA